MEINGEKRTVNRFKNGETVLFQESNGFITVQGVDSNAAVSIDTSCLNKDTLFLIEDQRDTFKCVFDVKNGHTTVLAKAVYFGDIIPLTKYESSGDNTVEVSTEECSTPVLQVGEGISLIRSDLIWCYIQGVISRAPGRIMGRIVKSASNLSIDDLKVVPKEETDWRGNDDVIAGAFWPDGNLYLPIVKCELSQLKE